MIATWNPDEGEITSHFSDRLAMSLSADAQALTVKDRVEAVENVINFSGSVEDRDASKYMKKELKSIADDLNLRKIVTSAREKLSQVQIDEDQILYLCEEATRAGCDGQRGEIFACQIAKTCAALDDRKFVNAADLCTAVRLALAHRSKYYLGDELGTDENETNSQNDEAPTAPPGEDGYAETEESPPKPLEEMTEERIMEEQTAEHDESENSDNEQTETFAIPEEFMFGVNMVPIDPKLLSFLERAKKGKGGKRSKQYNLERGR